MKIAMAVHGYPPELEGGTERHVQGIATALAARGHEVTVLAGTLEWSHTLRTSRHDGGGVRVVRIHRDDYRYERWDRLHHPGVSRLVAELLAELRPDVLHVHHWLRLTTDLVRVGIGAGVPVVLTLHDFFSTCPTAHRVLPDQGWCQAPVGAAPCAACLGHDPHDEPETFERRLALRHADLRNELELASHRLALSRSHAEALRAQLADAPPIEPQPFVSDQVLQPGPPPPPAPPLRILTLGQIHPAKGHHVLLEALQQARHRDEIETHLFGTCADPAYEQQLRALAGDLQVTWRGHYEFEQLEREPFHLAVLPTLCHETHGLVLDEAFMLGVPVLASDRGAYHERVGEGGALFASGDPAALAALLDRAVEQPDWLQARREGVTQPEPFGDLIDFLEARYRSAAAAGPSQLPDGFDAAAHLELLHRRANHFERRALSNEE